MEKPAKANGVQWYLFLRRIMTCRVLAFQVVKIERAWVTKDEKEKAS